MMPADTALLEAHQWVCVALTFANMYAERTVGLGLITPLLVWRDFDCRLGGTRAKAITTGMNATGFQKTRWFP